MPGSGDHAVLRQLHWGRIWSAFPAIVVDAEPRRLVTWLPPGVTTKAADGDLFEGWELTDRRLRRPRGVLRVTEHGAGYSLLHFWREDDSFAGWYLNLEGPLVESPVGWDYEDDLLDVWLAADGTWRWLDEDELRLAVELGLRSEEEARTIRAAGQRGLERLLAAEPPARTGWEDWRPDPGWPMPALPADWDAAPHPSRTLR